MGVIEKVQATIERDNLIPGGVPVIVGISGGADSVALLHILQRLGTNVTAAHLNHSIRGAEADADEQFVKDLCAKLGVECVTAKADVPALAKAKGISLEMAAREARHDFFRSLTAPGAAEPLAKAADSCPLTPVFCLAHHADDQLETFFLRAARGSSPAGLGGMKRFQTLEAGSSGSLQFFQGLGNADAFAGMSRALSRQPRNVVGQASLYSENLCSSREHEDTRSLREARPTIQDEEERKLLLIRPMLGIRRSEILDWLVDEGLEWREDVSNADESIPRNRVRHQILPNLGKINGRAAGNILRTMEVLRDGEDHPEKAAARREALGRLVEFGVPPSFDAIEQFIGFSSRTDGTTYLDLEGVRLINEYGKVGRAVPGEPKTVTMKEGIGILRGRWEASVSPEKIDGREVTVRAPRPGDRMNPFGMAGSKKLQDIFTDLKIPKAQRADWPVVECGGEIIWLPGYRIARGWGLAGKDQPALHLFASEVASNQRES